MLYCLIYLPWLIFFQFSFCPLLPFRLLASPLRAAMGQTSLVVSSVDFLEPLKEAEELVFDSISVKDIAAWH